MFRLLAALVLLVGGAAFATTFRPLSLGELAAGSDTVVRGRVLAKSTVRSERSGRILTRSRVEVLEALKGEPARELELDQLGGTLDAKTLRVPGDAVLETNEEVVLFLRCAGKTRCHLYGLGLGKYSVRREGKRTIAVRDASELAVAPGGQAAPSTLPLAELAEGIRRAGR